MGSRVWVLIVDTRLLENQPGGMRWLLVCVLVAVATQRSLQADGLKHVTACEFEDVELSCPQGTHLHIDTAYYGRKNSSLTCADSHALPPETCWVDVKANLTAQCTEATGCSLDVSNDVMGHDPCVGYHKYLTVEYLCPKGGQQRQTVCEHNQMDIRCGSGAPQISSAFYGMKDQRMCADVEMPKRECWFAVKDSFQAGCNLKSNYCKLDVTNANFWADPCWAVSKYVTVDYSCLDGSAESEMAADIDDNKKEEIVKNIQEKFQDVESKLIDEAIEDPEKHQDDLNDFKPTEQGLTEEQMKEVDRLREEELKKKQEEEKMRKEEEERKKKEEEEKKQKEEEEKKKKEEAENKKKEEEEKKRKEEEEKKKKEDEEKKKKEEEERKKKEEEERKKKEEEEKKKKEEEEKRKKEEEEKKKAEEENKKRIEEAMKKKKEEEEKKKKEEEERKRKEEEEKKKKEEEERKRKEEEEKKRKEEEEKKRKEEEERKRKEEEERKKKEEEERKRKEAEEKKRKEEEERKRKEEEEKKKKEEEERKRKEEEEKKKKEEEERKRKEEEEKKKKEEEEEKRKEEEMKRLLEESKTNEHLAALFRMHEEETTTTKRPETTTTTPHPVHHILNMLNSHQDKKEEEKKKEEELKLLLEEAKVNEHLAAILHMGGEEEKTTTTAAPEVDHMSLLLNKHKEEKAQEEDHLSRLLGAHHSRDPTTTTTLAPREPFCKKDESCCMEDPDQDEFFPACQLDDIIKMDEFTDFNECKRHCASNDKCHLVEMIDGNCLYHAEQCTVATLGSLGSTKSKCAPVPCTKQCENCGLLDEETCTCNCEGLIYSGPTCSNLNCPASDHPRCMGMSAMCSMFGCHFEQDCPYACGLCH